MCCGHFRYHLSAVYGADAPPLKLASLSVILYLRVGFRRVFFAFSFSHNHGMGHGFLRLF
jgi:hypothetical protein